MIYINGVAQVGAGDMTKAVYDSDDDGRVEKDALKITLNKILKGVGAGADPTEIGTQGVVNEVIGCTTGDLTYYVDFTNGLDSNPGTDAEPFKTIAYTISQIPKIIRHVVTIYLKADTWAEPIDLREFIITGAAGAEGVLYIRGTTITITDHNVSNIVIHNCFGRILFRYLNLTTTTTDAVYIFAFAGYCQVRNCSATGATATYDGYKVWGSSSVEVRDTALSNKNHAIYGMDFCHIYSLTNSGTGNAVGLSAHNGSVIAKQSTQPGGTLAEESDSGAVIR